MLLKIEGLLATADAARIREMLADVKYVDGRATAGEAVRDVKNNLQASGQEKQLDDARQLIAAALLKSEPFTQSVLPRRILPAMFNRYDSGMEYGGHVDNAIMGGGEPMRADVSITVFLNDAADYDGGELVINSDGEANRVKLGVGGAVVYSSSTIHRVMPVTRGSRQAAVLWAQSFVRDEARREILLELAQAAKWARTVSSGSQEAMKLSKVRANLMRMWAEL
jgi:PKHD-type hydroxylase